MSVPSCTSRSSYSNHECGFCLALWPYHSVFWKADVPEQRFCESEYEHCGVRFLTFPKAPAKLVHLHVSFPIYLPQCISFVMGLSCEMGALRRPSPRAPSSVRCKPFIFICLQTFESFHWSFNREIVSVYTSIFITLLSNSEALSKVSSEVLMHQLLGSPRFLNHVIL